MIISKTIFRFTSNKFCKDLALLALFLIALILTISLAKSIKAQIVDFNSNQDAGGVTNLMSAVNNNDEEGVKFYIRGGSSIVNKKNSGGASALHVATRNGYFNIVKILVENGANVNEEDNEGWTPAMRSALLGDHNTMEYLIKNNADLSKSNNFNETAIIHSSASDCIKCLEIIFADKSLHEKMNYMFLKDQLEESYEISRAHDNKQIQNLIISYQNEIANIKQIKESSLENALDHKNEVESFSNDNKDQPSKGNLINSSGSKKSKFKLKNFDQAQELSNQNLQESSLNKSGNEKENKKSKFIVKDLQKDKLIDKKEGDKKSKYKLQSPNLTSNKTNQESNNDQKPNNSQNEIKKFKYKLINKDQEKVSDSEINSNQDNVNKNESGDKADKVDSNQNEGKKIIYNLNYKQVQISSDQPSENNKQKNNQPTKEQKLSSDKSIKKDISVIKKDNVDYKKEEINKNSLLKSMIIENPNYISDLMGS